MKSLWKIIGRIGGYVLWLPIALAIRFTTRTRVLIMCQGEILVLQGWLSTRQWSFPGGGIRRGEEPVEAAIRELQEEVGIVVKNTELKSLGLMKQTRGHAHRFEGFTLQLKVKPSLRLQASEVTEAVWVKPSQLQKMTREQHAQLLLEAWQKQR